MSKVPIKMSTVTETATLTSEKLSRIEELLADARVTMRNTSAYSASWDHSDGFIHALENVLKILRENDVPTVDAVIKNGKLAKLLNFSGGVVVSYIVYKKIKDNKKPTVVNNYITPPAGSGGGSSTYHGG